MREVPANWASCPITAFCEKFRGVSYKKDEAIKRPEKNHVPIIRANNIFNDKLVFDDLVFVPAERVRDLQKILKYDVIVAMSSGSKKVVGKTAQATKSFNVAFGAFCGLLRPNHFINPKYFGYFFQTSEYRKAISDLASGTNINNLKNEHFDKISIPFPPLNEQRRIVEKLDKLLAKVDAARERLARIPAILKRFRQSVLAAAVSGELTKDWREKNWGMESAESIIEELMKKRLDEAEKAEKKHKITHIYSSQENDDNSELPRTWKYITLDKLCSSFQYGSSKKSQKAGKIPVLRMGNIQNGKIDWTGLVYSSDTEEIHKYFLRPNTVLFNRTNSPELVGKTGIYRGEKPAIFAGYLIGINNYAELDSEYLNFCLNSEQARQYCSRVKSDGVSQSNINAQKLGKFEIPFCALKEQKEIVKRVEALFKTADQIEARYRKAKAYVDQLTQSILAKAFRGELAPQDPNDEPASALLERIRAEKAKREAEQAQSRKPKVRKGRA